MTDTAERVEEHLKSMEEEFILVYKTPFPKEVFIEVLEENIKEQVKRFLKDRSDYLSAQVQYDIIKLLKNEKPKTDSKDGSERESKPKAKVGRQSGTMQAKASNK